MSLFTLIDWFRDNSDYRLGTKLLMILLIGGMIGYWIGQIQMGNYQQSSIVINDQSDLPPTAIAKVEQIKAINTGTGSTDTGLTDSSEVTEVVKAKYEIVFGSVNGSKYYNYGCKSGYRIKPDNRVFFENIAEAELHGYEPAVNCDFSI